MEPDRPELPAPRGWYHRYYLPHYSSPEALQFITWRLADALPVVLQKRLEEELALMDMSDSEHEAERRKRIEAIIDRGYGHCWFRRPACAHVVQETLTSEDGSWYQLHGWVIMPNHVHLLVQFTAEHPMEQVVKWWKGTSAEKVNTVLKRSGQLWQEDYWDRYIRDHTHYEECIRYIALNPVQAGLVKSPHRYSWWWSLRRPRR